MQPVNRQWWSESPGDRLSSAKVAGDMEGLGRKESYFALVVALTARRRKERSPRSEYKNPIILLCTNGSMPSF